MKTKLTTIASLLMGMAFPAWVENINFQRDYSLLIGQAGVVEIRSSANDGSTSPTVIARCTKKINPEFYERFLQAVTSVNGQPYPTLQFVISVEKNDALEVINFVLKPYYTTVADDPATQTAAPVTEWFYIHSTDTSVHYEVGSPRSQGNIIIFNKGARNLWVSQNRSPGVYQMCMQIVQQALQYVSSGSGTTSPTMTSTAVTDNTGPLPNDVGDRTVTTTPSSRSITDMSYIPIFSVRLKYNQNSGEIYTVSICMRQIN